MGQVIRYFILFVTLWSSCCFADPLEDLAKATGGMVYHMDKANNGLVPVFQGAVNEMVTNSILMMAYDVPAQNEIHYTFAIDPSISELLVIVAATKQNEKPKVSLMKPDKQPIANDAIKINESSVIISVKNPVVGEWKLSVYSRNPVSFQIKAISTVTIHSQETFKKQFGREGSDYIPSNDKLSPSESVHFRIQMTAPIHRLKQLGILAIADGGIVLASAKEVIEQHGPTGTIYISGNIIMPSQPFRIMVVGVDVTGIPFQRMGNYPFKVNETRPVSKM